MLYESFVTSRAGLLRAALQTAWELLEVPDPSDTAVVGAAIREADAFIGNRFTLELAAMLTPPSGARGHRQPPGPPEAGFAAAKSRAPGRTEPAALASAERRLRLLHCVGAGVDQFDLQAIPPGCVLCNVYEHEIPIAEYVMLCILLHATRLQTYQASFRQGQWAGSARNEGEFHDEVYGRTLGLIGFGHIGQAVAGRARAFGMRVLAVWENPAAPAGGQPHPPELPDLAWCGGTGDLDHLLAESDYIVLACPLTSRTRGLVGEREVRLLKPTAMLINPARAEIVDEDALYAALRDGRVAGAALDVWYQYPPAAGVRLHGSRRPFHELPNVIATPHLSAWTEPMIQRRYRRIAENLDRFATGQPVERVVFQS